MDSKARQPSDASLVGSVRRSTWDNPYVVLAFVAVGLIAFGAFAFVEAWYRPIRPEAAFGASSKAV